MNSSSRQSATLSIGSFSSCTYSEDEFKFDINLMDTQTHHVSHSQPNIRGLRRESAQNFERTSTVSFSRSLITPDLKEDLGYNRDTPSSYTAARRFETQEGAEERRRGSAAEARVAQDNIRRDTSLDESPTYMQRVLAEHDAANARENSDQYHFEDEDVEEPSNQLTVPTSGHIRVISFKAVPSQHMRGTLWSTTSLASTDSEELTEESAHKTDECRCILQEGMQGSDGVEDSFQPVTPRPRALSLLDIPSELRLDRSSTPAPNRSINQSATLSALDGVSGKSDSLPRGSSGQWLGATARHSPLAARRQGRVDWQKTGCFSSSGRQYGLGNHEEGYLASDYVTFIRDDARPGKEKRKRDAWKRMTCF
jgi:hypothetical protein